MKTTPHPTLPKTGCAKRIRKSGLSHKLKFGRSKTNARYHLFISRLHRSSVLYHSPMAPTNPWHHSFLRALCFLVVGLLASPQSTQASGPYPLNITING